MGKTRRKTVRVVESWVPLPDRYQLTHNADEDTVADVDGLRANAPRDDRYSTAHEIGHLFLESSIGDRERARFQKILGMGGQWDQGTGLHGGYSSPAEFAADYYAAAATGYRPDGGQGVAGYTQIDPKKLKRFKRYLAKVGQGSRQYGSDGRTDYGVL
jgi:hypothetical protein